MRKKPKAYGAFANEYVEGPYDTGQHVLLLEDVVTNGRDLLAAAKRLRELGLKGDAVRGHQPGPRAGTRADPVFTPVRRPEDRQLDRDVHPILGRGDGPAERCARGVN